MGGLGFRSICEISQCCDSPRARDQYADDRGASPCTAEADLELEALQRRLSTQIKSSRRMLQIFTIMAKRNASSSASNTMERNHPALPGEAESRGAQSAPAGQIASKRALSMLRAETRSGEELLSLAAGAHKRHKATSLNDVDPLEIPTEQESKSSWRRDRDSLRGLRAPGADGAADGLRAPRDGGEYADFAGEDPAMGERGRPSGLLATGRAAGGSRSGGASAPALRQGAAGLGPGGQGTTEGAQHGAAVKPALTAVAGGNTLTALASTVKLEAGCYKLRGGGTIRIRQRPPLPPLA